MTVNRPRFESLINSPCDFRVVRTRVLTIPIFSEEGRGTADSWRSDAGGENVVCVTRCSESVNSLNLSGQYEPQSVLVCKFNESDRTQLRFLGDEEVILNMQAMRM
ncbi:MAG: hypothetical protein DRP09_06685 [Candidatus Thorarchaeota archaeon]|nr:MAG: hypothetical protein DRP09_06685 [Candidatus Thorarchaeota archaeon]